MATTHCSILNRQKNHPINIVVPSNFELGAGESIDPGVVLRDPSFSVYCFDREREAVLFVQCPQGANIEAAPFYYQAQFESAVSVVVMPYATFHELAEKIEEPKKGLIFIHSVGRCGSTLVSKAFAAVPSIHSLSEPDDLTQMIAFRTPDGSENGWLRQMIDSSIRWRCKARHGTPAEYVAIKTRSEVLALGDILYTSFPKAKHPFLYRDGLEWMRTAFRSYPETRDVYDRELNRESAASWVKSLPTMREYLLAEEPLNAVEIRVLGWIACMEGYLQLLELGAEPFAVRFQDLITESEAMLTKLFQFCGVEITDWDAMRRVLEQDSQAGSIYAREERMKFNRQLTDELVQDVRNLIAERPLLGTPDVVLPGTVFP